jgi:3-dehydroquinate synthase
VPRFDVSSRTGPPWTTRVVVQTGALAQAAATVARTYRGRRGVVVSDARVARLYAGKLVRLLERGGLRTVLLRFPAGERAKTRETKSLLEDRLAALGVGRDTVVIALGGGVTGDLAGFLAATWHRGVPVVQIPTTTLAMIDAALGGKTGVDLTLGKNLVGAFHPPESLWADISVLRTLPERTFRSGLAEAVKIAAALDAPLFAFLEANTSRILARGDGVMTRLVARCLELKGQVVADDARDAGRRAVLNFGHTAAHALETASAYRLPHGDAVAIGLVAEARLAERLTGLPAADADRIEALLAALGLPTRPPRRLDRSRLRSAMTRDKKTRAGVARCVVPRALGRMLPGPDPSVAIDASRDLLPFLHRV